MNYVKSKAKQTQWCGLVPNIKGGQLKKTHQQERRRGVTGKIKGKKCTTYSFQKKTVQPHNSGTLQEYHWSTLHPWGKK